MPILAIFPDIIYKLFQYNFFPNPLDIFSKKCLYLSRLINKKECSNLNFEDEISKTLGKSILIKLVKSVVG